MQARTSLLSQLGAISISAIVFAAATLFAALYVRLSTRARPQFVFSDLLPDIAGQILPLPPELDLAVDIAQWSHGVSHRTGRGA